MIGSIESAYSSPPEDTQCKRRRDDLSHRPPGEGDAQLLPSGRALYRHNAAAAGVNNLFLSSAFVLVSE
jgi:hypothetical protein